MFRLYTAIIRPDDGSMPDDGLYRTETCRHLEYILTITTGVTD
jgi:hypothetical protein